MTNSPPQPKSKKLLRWEIGNFLFIGLFGASLHYVFELSDFWRPIGWLGAVNESTWEHLKLVFWPAVLFSLVEYTYVKDVVQNFVVAKAVSIIVMMSIIVATWYIYTPLVGNVNWLNIAIFYVAVLIGQYVSYRLLNAGQIQNRFRHVALASLLLLTLAFTLFTYYPPTVSLFEHFDLQDTGEYGILEDYEAIRVFRGP
jgi:hypothetical protein